MKKGVRFIWSRTPNFYKLRDLFFTIELWLGDCNKSTCSRNHHTIQAAAGTVNHQQIPVFVLASHNANVLILRVKGQIAGLGLAPGNVSAIGVLGIGPAAVINDISAAGSVVEHPVYEHPRPGRRLLCNLLYSRISDQPFL